MNITIIDDKGVKHPFEVPDDTEEYVFRIPTATDNYVWIDYPTETGWWWSKRKGKKPEMCCIVAKKTAKKDVVIAIYPERECKLYLDTIYPDIVWQKVKRYVA